MKERKRVNQAWEELRRFFFFFLQLLIFFFHSIGAKNILIDPLIEFEWIFSIEHIFLNFQI